MDVAASSSQRQFSWMPIIVINVCNAVSMYTLVSVLPYAAFMTADFQGISVDKAGYLSGYLASSFTVGRTLSGYFWGWASDRFGRVPMLLWSMLSIATLSIAFGMSSSLWMAMGIRFALGLMNSVMSTTRTLTPELAGKERVVTAVSFFGGTRSLALMVGASLGGLLSQPAVHFPSIFSSTGLFGRYPYLLPNLVGACSACIAIPLIIIFIPETKNLNGGRYYCRRRVRRGAEYYKPAEVDNDTDALGRKDARKPENLELEEEEEMEREGAPREAGVFGPGGLMSIPHIPTLLLMTMIFAGCLIGLEELYPLWALSSRDAGGLGYSTVQIGKVLGCAAFGLFLSQFVLYPRLVSCFGIATVQHVAGTLSTLLPLLAPNVPLVTRDATSLMVLLIIVLGIAHCMQAMANTGIQLAGTNPVPPRLRGKLSGLFLTAQSIGRSVTPVLFATTFAWSISPEGRRLPLVDHRLTFTMAACLLGFVALLGIRTLTTETMTHVADDPPESPYVEPSPRPRNIGDGATMSPYPERRDKAESIVIGNRKADLV